MISLLMLCCCSSQQNSEENEDQFREPLDEFYLKAYGFYLRVQLFSDGTFQNEVNDYHNVGEERKKEVYGTYALTNNKLVFYPNKVILNNNSIESEDRTDTLTYSYSDSTKIQTTYYKIDFDGISVLVSDAEAFKNNETFPRSSNLIALANMVNAGGEFPVQTLLLSNTDTILTIDKAKLYYQIPSAWQSYFLKEPVIGKVERVEVTQVDYHWGNSALIPNYDLSSTSSSRLKKGMKMYAIDGSCEEILVTAIEGESIKGKGRNQFYQATKCNLGRRVSTQRERTN